ncbi:MAG: DUF1585 domain-containing protein, partial [Myxococcota bacterium]
EGYDALGRHRTEQRLFDAEGNVVATEPIDTSAVPRVHADDESVVAGPRELSEVILDSGKLHGCFARHYLRFTFARDEDLEADACVLSEIVETLGQDAPLADALRAIAAHPDFKQRNFD